MKLSFKVEGKMGRMQTKSEIISARSFQDLCIFLLLLRFRLTCLYPNPPLPYLEMKNDSCSPPEKYLEYLEMKNDSCSSLEKYLEYLESLKIFGNEK